MSIRITLITVLMAVSMASVCAQESDNLFTHQWVPGDELSPKGDGLGPVFNGNSCVQCHHQGGVGGGGTVAENMDFVSQADDKIRARLKAIKAHSGFQDRNGMTKDSIILHRFSLDEAYSRIRKDMLQFDGAVDHGERDRTRLRRAISINPLQQVEIGAGVHVVRSQRNSSALFGAGIIDRITDETLLILAREHKPTSSNVSGRLSAIGMDSAGQVVRLGRFGWRGQTASLSEFVRDACAFELGLETEAQPQTPDPRNPKYRPAGPDLNRSQLVELSRFVERLPRPEQILPNDDHKKARVVHGEKVFMKMGCADCHIPNVAGNSQIYSDFMLHDMGEVLSDPVPASQAFSLNDIAESVGRVTQELNPFSGISGSGSGGSYGGGSPRPRPRRFARTESGKGSPTIATRSVPRARLQTNVSREWRTPPLWGVADSAPYMHDGRATTLVEAIATHGGEASDSVEAYFTARVQDQLALVEFLKTLRAPRSADVVQSHHR